jgi:hypothetical protein
LHVLEVFAIKKYYRLALKHFFIIIGRMNKYSMFCRFFFHNNYINISLPCFLKMNDNILG